MVKCRKGIFTGNFQNKLLLSFHQYKVSMFCKHEGFIFKLLSILVYLESIIFVYFEICLQGLNIAEKQTLCRHNLANYIEIREI